MITCKDCGTSVEKGVNVCPNCGRVGMKMPLWKKILIGFGLFMLVGIIGNIGDKSKTSSKQSSSPPPPPPSSSSSVDIPSEKLKSTVPVKQQNFTNVVHEYKKKYSQATNELKKSSVRKQRFESIADSLENNTTIENWIGTISDMETTGDGNAFISIRLKDGKDIKIQTWNNQLSDIMTGSLIKNGSELYNQISNLSTNNTVKFSGYFVTKEGMLDEQSISEEGSMASPEFTFMFSNVSKL